MEIATIGEALIDFKATDRMAFHGYVGGCHLNVAVAAARLGAATGFVGQVSSDFFGDEIRAHMRENRVNDEHVHLTNAPTTLAFVSERGGDAHFQFFGERAADRMYDPRPRPDLPGALAFLMFGSISLLHEPACSSILDIVDAHRDRCTTVLDPNVRPLLLGDREAYVRGVESWLPHASLVKVSAQDIGWLYPGEPAGAVAAGWLDAGPDAIIVTHGAQRVALHRASRDVLTVRPPSIEPVDTVGAGDAFTGALMVALVEAGVGSGTRNVGAALEDDAWRAALEFAAGAAALNCTREGADPPRRAALTHFLQGS